MGYESDQERFLSSNNLNIGSVVFVARGLTEDDKVFNWTTGWVEGMDAFIGKYYEIFSISPAGGIILARNGNSLRYYFPWFVLAVGSQETTWKGLLCQYSFLKGMAINEKSRKGIIALRRIFSSLSESEILQIVDLVMSVEGRNNKA